MRASLSPPAAQAFHVYSWDFLHPLSARPRCDKRVVRWSSRGQLTRFAGLINISTSRGGRVLGSYAGVVLFVLPPLGGS